MIARCKVCDVRKPKLSNGILRGKQFVYKDADGYEWSGKVCPSCHRDDERQRHRAKVGIPILGAYLRPRDQKGKFIKRFACVV